MEWASRLGLAHTPMFAGEPHSEGEHFLLLDGLHGSFGFSQVDRIDRDPAPRSWAWSSGVLHHVSACESEILVHRWDRSEPVAFRRAAVDRQLDRFYDVLVQEQSSLSLTITDHAVDAFRRLRSHFASEQGARALPVFLLLLSAMVEDEDEANFEDAGGLARRYQLPESSVDGLAGLSTDFDRHLVSGFRRPVMSRDLGLTTFPRLLLRHAGAMVFQEAHTEAVAGGGHDLFGFPDAASSKADVSSGVHYTPPGLARALAEQALQAYGRLGPELVVLDPACGSSSILHELLRILKDRAYDGVVRIIGFDISPAAVQTSRFFLAVTGRDWPELNIASVQIAERDALDGAPWPVADIVIMNPPFISLRALSPTQRQNVKEALGPYDRGRPDMSMAFVEKAVSSVRDGGVVASLVPAGVLSMTHGRDWRNHLLEQTEVAFLAGFGEVGLFRMATVEVGAVVMRRTANPQSTMFSSLWVGEKRNATSQALRFLRRSRGNPLGGSEPDRWALDERPIQELKQFDDWRPRPRFLQRELSKFSATTRSTVGDLFAVRQGALPAPREAFILQRSELEALPMRERRWFRPMAENANIRSGRILPGSYVFYSRTQGLPVIADEDALAEACPVFLERLLPFKAQLVKRRGKGERWWELGEDRSWLRKPAPKIVTSYFGAAGSFAVDVSCDHVVVQGYGWLPSWGRSLPEGLPLEQILHAYVALLNTEIFQRILAEFCPVVGGGQMNLSRRFITRVPMPDLLQRAQQSDGDDQILRDLATIGESITQRGLPYSPRAQAEFLTGALYGVRS